MMKTSSISIYLSVALTMCMGALAQAQVATPGAPAFSDALLGHTNFRGQNVSVIPRADRWGREINPRGEVSGAEFLALAKPMDRAAFEKMLKAGGQKTPEGQAPDFDKLYADYLQSLTQQALSVLWMSRILDHESMKGEIPAAPSNSRVYYVLRSILAENAIQRGNIPADAKPAEWLSTKSDADLYALLQASVGARNVRFNIDWKYNQNGLAGMFQYLSANEGQWPVLTLSFPRLPVDVKEFSQSIREKLLPVHLQLARSATWMRLVRNYEQSLARRTLGRLPNGGSPAELRKLYEAVKDASFSVQDATAEVEEFTVAGAKAQEFLARLDVVSLLREQALMQEAIGDPTKMPTDEEAAKAQAYVLEQRKIIPGELVASVLAEFAAAQAAGELTVTSALRALVLKGGEELPTGETVEDAEKRAVFNSGYTSRLLPKTAVNTVGSQSTQVLYLRILTMSDARLLPFEDVRVQRALVAKAQERYRAFIEREVAYELFRYNSFSVESDTCTDPIWPCLNQDPMLATETVFLEKLLTGEALAAGVNSTVNQADQLGKVADINRDLFNRVLQVSNAARE